MCPMIVSYIYIYVYVCIHIYIRCCLLRHRLLHKSVSNTLVIIRMRISRSLTRNTESFRFRVYWYNHPNIVCVNIHNYAQMYALTNMLDIHILFKPRNNMLSKRASY